MLNRQDIIRKSSLSWWEIRLKSHKPTFTGARLNTQDPISQLHRIALEIVQPRIEVNAKKRI